MNHIKWVNGSCKEDNRIFDSEFEAEKWADSIYPDFIAYFGYKQDVGYATPDKKVIKHLEVLMPQWAAYNNLQVNVRTEHSKLDGRIIYKIWTEQ
ncbi:hypothetical protein ACFYKT_14540 [Cytobacillus sp. FJAT-53684]|uniref:Uncharacterized protein n=1 Tax=Cytobacillus mangrovibacter TaxID=3299024 RepID=A0ABW6K067_9BACI